MTSTTAVLLMAYGTPRTRDEIEPYYTDIRRGPSPTHEQLADRPARADEPDKVAGLEGGADDYVTKPFSPRELVARIHAVLRRAASAGGEEMVEYDGLQLDQASHRVMAGERSVPLGPTEYRMLEFFMTHPERVYSREQLLDRVWGGNVYVEERTIDVHIRRLRSKLGRLSNTVRTVRGQGYRFYEHPEVVVWAAPEYSI